MADLEVDDTLADTVTSLAVLHRELSALDRRRDQVRSAWGSDDVPRALDDFIDD